ncbi:uncharacterized [Tachysurus ichikawai]
MCQLATMSQPAALLVPHPTGGQLDFYQHNLAGSFLTWQASSSSFWKISVTLKCLRVFSCIHTLRGNPLLPMNPPKPLYVLIKSSVPKLMVALMWALAALS